MSSNMPGLNPLYNLSPEQVLRAQSTQWRQIVRQALDDTRCASPAFLTENLDPVTQTVTVQVAIQERVRTNKGPAWTDLPIIIKVPVVLPRGGGFSLTLPLKKGDEGLLVFCDTCFDFWWHNGQTNSPVASGKTAPSGTQRQNEVRRHYIHDCGFIPGMCSQPNNLSAYSTTSMQLRSDDGTTVIDVAAGSVTVTGAQVIVNASTSATVISPAVSVKAASGTPQFLVTADWLTWYTTNIQPFLVSKGYVGPVMPSDSHTTVLKGQ